MPLKTLQKDPVLARIIETTPEYKKAFEFGGDVYLALIENVNNGLIN